EASSAAPRKDSSNYPRNKATRSTSDDQDYRSRSRNAKSKGKRSHRSRKESAIDIQAALWFLIFIEVLILLGLVCAFYALATRRILVRPRIWRLQTIPGTGGFEEMAISSSSEHCSELARTLFVEGIRPILIASVVKFCMEIQQPDRSGKLGSSVAVHYSNSTGCRCTSGQSEMSNSKSHIQKFVHQVRVDPSAEGRGPFSELFPNDLSTTLAFLEGVTRDEMEHAASVLYMEHGEKLIALTIYSVSALELGFLMKDEMLFDKTAEMSRRDKAEIVTIPNFHEKLEEYFSMFTIRDDIAMRYAYINRNLTFKDKNQSDVDDLPKFLTEKQKFDQLLYQPRWWPLEPMPDKDGRKYCYPTEPSIAPHLFSMLEGNDSSASDYIGNQGIDADRAFEALWYYMNTLYEKVYSQSHIPHEWTPFFTLEDRPEELRPMGANFFTLTTPDEAFAYIGTLGSRFGSLSSKAYMNNLAHNFAYKFDKSKGYSNSLHPFLMISNDRVDAAYAGSPGFPTLSLGIPRMLFSIIMHNVFNVKLEEAVSYPLIFPNLEGNRSFYHNGYPFSDQIAKDKIKSSTYAPQHFRDSAAVIEVRIDEKTGTRKQYPFYKNKKVLGFQFNTRALGV
ncbi:hypothetical protein V3C99_001062, partial [Haemonchus contortus]